MSKEVMTLTYDCTAKGRKQMDFAVNQAIKYGWEIDSRDVTKQGYAPVKTLALGALFLPAALLGKKKDAINVTLTREYDPNRTGDADLTGRSLEVMKLREGLAKNRAQWAEIGAFFKSFKK